MRIAFIRQRYNPFGGGERFVERATRALARQGAAVTVISRSWSEEAASEVRLVRCDPYYLGRLLRDLTFARAACRHVREAGFDLVQSHERLSCCDLYRAGDGVHRQWLRHRGRMQSSLQRLLVRVNPYHRYLMAQEARLFRSDDVRAIICNSQMVRNDVLRYFPEAVSKLHVIYNGVDLQHFHPSIRTEHRASTRAQLGIREDEKVFLFVGSGFARKGVDRLLRAFANLGRAGTRLVIVGADRKLAQSRRCAERLGVAPLVTFTGGVADVRPYYAGADIFVLPTLYDPFPNAAVEALASGLPVVTTFQSGAAELIRPGENGAVCDALDIPALTRSLTEVAQIDPAAAREHACASVSSLGMDAMAEKLLRLYSELLASSAGGTQARAENRSDDARVRSRTHRA